MSMSMDEVRRAQLGLGYYDASYDPSVWTPDPTLATLAPNTRVQNSAAATITLTGTNFATDAVVVVDGVVAGGTRVSATSMTLSYAPGPIGSGSRAFKVRNVSVNEDSNVVNLTVTAT